MLADTWIKVEYSTLEKIEVAKTATALGMDRYMVVGRLVRIWSYFDIQARDGRIDGIDANFLDRMVQHSGFCAQLAAVGWMTIDAAGITLPNFDRHNGGGAKTRAQGAARQSKHLGKTKRDKSNAPRNAAPLRGALPEKIRGEEKREEENPLHGDAEQQPFLPFLPIAEDDEATRLAQNFAFLGGEGTSPHAITRARVSIGDLLAAGILPAAIDAEINRPGRARSEHPGRMRDRLMPAKESRNGMPNKPDPDAGHYDPGQKYPSAKQSG